MGIVTAIVVAWLVILGIRFVFGFIGGALGWFD